MTIAQKKRRNKGILIGVSVLALGGVMYAVLKKKPGADGGPVIVDLFEDYGPDMLGKYFSFNEFTRSNVATTYGISEQFNPESWQILNGRKLAQWILDPVREQLGGPVIVNSWYRCQALQNKLIALGYPAVQISRHLLGGTADVKFNYGGERRNDLLIRAVLITGVPFDRMLIEHGSVERPSWIQLEYDGTKLPSQQEGKIIRIPSGTSGSVWSRSYTEGIYL